MFKIPSRSTAMIGSMPGKTVSDAGKLLDEYPLSLPSWFQLPKRSIKEQMIPQYSEGFPGMVINEQERKFYIQKSDELMTEVCAFYEKFLSSDLEFFAISQEYSEGLHWFIERLAGNDGKVPFVKGQVTGPLTMGLGLNDNEGRPVWFDEEYRDVVLKGLTMKALWQIDQFQNYADNVFMFFDEPILSALGTASYISISDDDVISALNELIDAAHEKGVMTGVHCCGNMDWGLLARTNVDIMAFDAFYYGEKLALYPEQVNAFMERGGYLAWGIVPTSGHDAGDAPANRETVDSLNLKLSELRELFKNKGISVQRLDEQMIFTPSCGMGTLSIPDASNVLKLLHSMR